MARSTTSKAILGAALAAGAVALSARPALAHEVGLSRGTFSAEGTGVRAEVAFARKELASLVAGLDADHDGSLTQTEIDGARDSIQGAVVGRFKVMGDGVPCPGRLEHVELAEQDGVTIGAIYRCARRPKEATVTVTLLDDLAFGHRHLVRALAATGPLDLVLSQRVPTFSFPLPPDPGGASSTTSSGARPLLREGFLRTVTAWPLPVFLIGLLARASDRRAVFTSAAAFTAALLVGLLASALGLFTPSPRAVAIAVAVSLAYVGIDNLAGSRRAWIALPFGVVHGLGGAAAFRALDAPIGGLAAFVAGVFAAVSMFIALLAAARRSLAARPALEARSTFAIGIAVVTASMFALRAAF
ncbi:putative membrane protein [Minicystis rosea]|nr:putative membrane protein [Minicystis rosea]